MRSFSAKFKTLTVFQVVVLSSAFCFFLLLISPGGVRIAIPCLIVGTFLVCDGHALLYLLHRDMARQDESGLLALPVGLICFSGLSQVFYHLNPSGLWQFSL